MLLRMNNNGYEITDVDGLAMVSEDNRHEAIFAFADADLSSLTNLLEQYVQSIFNIETLELILPFKPDEDSLHKMHVLLSESHIFYEPYSSETIAQGIGEYFNSLLIYKTYVINHDIDSPMFSTLYDYNWYQERFKKLINDLIYEDDYFSFVNKYYTEYKIITEGDTNYYYQFVPKGFVSLLQQKEYINQWLFWLLDISVPEINALTLPQRKALYDHIFPKPQDEPIVSVQKRISFTDPHYTLWYQRDLETVEGEDKSLATAVCRYYADANSVSDEAKGILKSLMKDVQRDQNEAFFEEYDVDSIYQLLFLEVEQMIKSGIMIKRCRFCKKYFIVNNLNSEYCDRIPEGETQPCCEIGSKRSFQKKLEEDYPLKIYNRAYKTHYARASKGKMTRSEFNDWCILAREKLEAARSDNLDVNEFEVWLKK